MDRSDLDKNCLLKRWIVFFFSKLDCEFYIGSIAKTVLKKIGTLIYMMKFCSSDVALYLDESTAQSYMDYCCYV